MTYTSNVPLPDQSLGVTQPIINSNFQRISTVFAINHGEFNNTDPSASEGKHKFLQMPVRSPNGPATAANESALYTKDLTSFSVTNSNLYYRPENTAAGGNEVLLTNNFIPLAANNGYTFLPGGIIIQWGRKNFVGTGKQDVTIDFTTEGNIDFPSACFVAFATPRNDSDTSAAPTISCSNRLLTGFTVHWTGGSGYNAFQWLAIGN